MHKIHKFNMTECKNFLILNDVSAMAWFNTSASTVESLDYEAVPFMGHEVEWILRHWLNVIGTNCMFFQFVPILDSYYYYYYYFTLFLMLGLIFLTNCRSVQNDSFHLPM